MKDLLHSPLTLGLLGTLAFAAPAHAQTAPSNVVLIIADDVGTDRLGLYGVSQNTPNTPNIDALAAGGQIYREAWANPTCSPTRASVYTGKHAFRHGVGAAITDVDTDPELQTSETTLPELLAGAGYDSGLVGKWHLGDRGAESNACAAPFQHGWSYFNGALAGAVVDHYDWAKCTGGADGSSQIWTAADNVQDALTFLQQPRSGPFMLTVAFNMAHTPWQLPPAGTYGSAGRCPTNLRQTVANRDCYTAMIENLDHEIGRLLGAIDLRNTTVILVGDNGTPGQGVERGTYAPNKAKGTVYQGGVRVPLIISSPAITDAGWVEAPVEALDIFATVADLAGLSAPTAVDSTSLVPYFTRRNRAPLQAQIYSEGFVDADDCGPGDAAAIRGARYKLVRNGCTQDELYDLSSDPFEQTDLLQGELTVRERTAYNRLSQAMVALRGR